MSRVLVVTGGPGRDHAHDFDDPVTGTGPAIARMLRRVDHEVELTDDVEAAFLRASLDGYDVVVVNALRWRMEAPQYERWRQRWAMSISVEARDAITSFVHNGGGLVGNHTASICFDDWPEWAELLGGGWVWGTSSHPAPAPVEVRVVDHEHPVTAGLPGTFTLVDEVYGDQAMQPDTMVLAVARRTPDDTPQPVVWATTRGDGRVVYDGFGHDAASLQDPIHDRLICQAVDWVAGHDRVGVGG